MYSIFNKLKFTNATKYYDCFVKIHLVKILDINDDTRKLLDQITNNKFDINELVPDSESTSSTNSTNATQTTNETEAAKLIRKSKIFKSKDDIPKQNKEILCKVLDSSYRNKGTASNFSKIPED